LIPGGGIFFSFNIGDMKLYRLHLLFSNQRQPVLAVPLQGTAVTVAEVIKKRQIIFINLIRQQKSHLENPNGYFIYAIM